MNYMAFNKISYGVYVVSSKDEYRPTGCVANSVMQITAEPATIAVSINKDNFTNKCIKDLKKFSISVLSENTPPTIIGTFGYRSGKDFNKYEDLKTIWRDELPIVASSCAYVTCELIDMMETQTHTVFLGKVLDADIISEDKPMTYAYYHEVIKGKSPKNAPTYIPE